MSGQLGYQQPESLSELLSNVVDGTLLGGDFLFDSVDEFDSLKDVGQKFGAVEESPLLGCGFYELETRPDGGGADAVPSHQRGDWQL